MPFRSKPALSDSFFFFVLPFIWHTHQISAANERLEAAASLRQDQADYRRHPSKECERLTSVTGVSPKSSNKTWHPLLMDPTANLQSSFDRSSKPLFGLEAAAQEGNCKAQFQKKTKKNARVAWTMAHFSEMWACVCDSRCHLTARGNATSGCRRCGRQRFIHCVVAPLRTPFLRGENEHIVQLARVVQTIVISSCNIRRERTWTTLISVGLVSWCVTLGVLRLGSDRTCKVLHFFLLNGDEL